MTLREETRRTGDDWGEWACGHKTTAFNWKDRRPCPKCCAGGGGVAQLSHTGGEGEMDERTDEERVALYLAGEYLRTITDGEVGDEHVDRLAKTTPYPEMAADIVDLLRAPR